MKDHTVFSLHSEVCKFWRSAGYQWFIMRNDVFYACVGQSEKIIAFVNCNNKIAYYLSNLNNHVVSEEYMLKIIKLKAFL